MAGPTLKGVELETVGSPWLKGIELETMSTPWLTGLEIEAIPVSPWLKGLEIEALLPTYGNNLIFYMGNKVKVFTKSSKQKAFLNSVT